MNNVWRRDNDSNTRSKSGSSAFSANSATTSAIRTSSIATIKALSPSRTIPNTMHVQSWKGGMRNELNRTKVYSISKKLSSAKVGNPQYLNSSHVIRAKPLHSSLHQKRSPSLKKNPFLCQFHFIFLNDLTINVLLFHRQVV